MSWLLTLLLNWIMRKFGYVPGPTTAAPPIDVSKEKVKIEPEIIQKGGDPTPGQGPQAQNAHGPI